MVWGGTLKSPWNCKANESREREGEQFILLKQCLVVISILNFNVFYKRHL